VDERSDEKTERWDEREWRDRGRAGRLEQTDLLGHSAAWLL